MTDENILADLRAWRDEFARAHGYDLAAMVATLREQDRGAGHWVVRGAPRRPVPITVSGRADTPHHPLQSTGPQTGGGC